MFSKILIANRGEIARRVQQTCKRLGIATVAVYSDADADAPFVRNATAAVHIGGAAAADSYLRQDRIIQAAKDCGAEAIHPGYGFLSENTDFARAVADAGLVFIGPRADTIALMGSKIASKRAMERAGIPCVPGYHGDDQSDTTLREQAARIGYPILIKASAGGGGKGMRVVHREDQFDASCAAARREAKSAFGDDRVLIEKFIVQPRHIEVQVFGDSHGDIVHLFERECSMQRRYQKIIEEAPSAFVDEALRKALTDTAVKAAAAVDYINAGTVEFIVAADRSFYFMEMNTRLQVEHPVTEMICGQDLVAWQLAVAAGEALPLQQGQITMSGHAIEARIYAEDPFRDFLPSSGLLTSVIIGSADARVDADIETGQEVSAHYDPMIAKLSVHAANRDAAIVALRRALDDTALYGPATNVPLLRALARHSDFVGANIDTGFLDRNLSDIVAAHPVPPLLALAACALDAFVDLPATPWSADGWQNSAQSRRQFRFKDAAGADHTLTLHATRDAIRVHGDGRALIARGVRRNAGHLEFVVDGVNVRAVVRRYGDWYKIAVGGVLHELHAMPVYQLVREGAAGADHPGAPMPGRIVKVFVAEGDKVSEGQALVALEGMKMEFTVTAAIAGTVAKILFKEGDQVDAEIPLVDLTPE